ncbi:hypothetical protein [Streptomyces sp. NPDC059092]|uniref:hypothetical protein n=1 Tax=Streptomyces sp. NPDC059092 TaxID=3346725 RepID=UPI0036888CD8
MSAPARDGMTMLVVPHEIAFAREGAERTVFIDDSGIVERDMAEQVTGAPGEPSTRQFLRGVLA